MLQRRFIEKYILDRVTVHNSLKDERSRGSKNMTNTSVDELQQRRGREIFQLKDNETQLEIISEKSNTEAVVVQQVIDLEQITHGDWMK